MLVLIDNYDSFVYNVYQAFGEFDTDIRVYRNNEITVAQLKQLQPSKIILSPGPKRPEEAGNMNAIIQYFYDKVPIFGICLGHQAICQVFGANITYAKEIMHGKTSEIEILNDRNICKGVNDKRVARYHSLVVEESSLPITLEILAKSKEGEIMAIKHRDYPVYGVQFHPESILSKEGKKVIENFMRGN